MLPGSLRPSSEAATPRTSKAAASCCQAAPPRSAPRQYHRCRSTQGCSQRAPHKDTTDHGQKSAPQCRGDTHRWLAVNGGLSLSRTTAEAAPSYTAAPSRSSRRPHHEPQLPSGCTAHRHNKCRVSLRSEVCTTLAGGVRIAAVQPPGSPTASHVLEHLQRRVVAQRHREGRCASITDARAFKAALHKDTTRSAQTEVKSLH